MLPGAVWYFVGLVLGWAAGSVWAKKRQLGEVRRLLDDARERLSEAERLRREAVVARLLAVRETGGAGEEPRWG